MGFTIVQPRQALNPRSRIIFSIFFAIFSLTGSIPGLAAVTTPDGNTELLRQQQREKALQEQQQAPDVRLEGRAGETTGRLPLGESPCFTIQRLSLVGESAERFQWALDFAADGDDTPIGRCLGADGINLVMKRLQNAIVGHGYVTTRILAAPQDLKSGTLQLTVIPGRIRAIRFTADADPRSTQWNAFPMRAGDLLNLRDIEQALENLKRVPTAEADIKIVPSEGDGARPGDSDLVISRQQAFPLRLTLSADDSGSKATGKQQGGITVSGDHLLALNDLFYFAWNHDIAGQYTRRSTHGRSIHYSLPFGYWLLAVNGSDYTYHQAVAGINQTYVYSGDSWNGDIRLSRIVWRDAVSKTTLGLRGWLRSSKNFIDDTEILVQRRRMAGWEFSAGERLFIDRATLDLNLAYRHGTGAFGALAAPEESLGEGTARPRLITADARFSQPFTLFGQNLRYDLNGRAQWNQTRLVPQDRFGIGGRYTVRGFDGETQLSAERGWLIRNDLATPLGGSGQEIYLGLDYGRVSGPSADLLVGKQLAGGVIGIRGSYRGLANDFFIGRPLEKPEGFRSASTTAGFTLSYSF